MNQLAAFTPAPPKRAKTRDVPLAEIVAVALSEHLREYGSGEGGLFFTSREHKPIARTYFNQHIWKPALVKAGIEPTRENGMHALRHYFASVLLDAGESIRAVSDYLGHSDPAFTLRVYTSCRRQKTVPGAPSTPQSRPRVQECVKRDDITTV